MYITIDIYRYAIQDMQGIYTPGIVQGSIRYYTQRSCLGYIGFTPSVRLSVHSSVRPSRIPVLVGSISYLYILSSNLRRCVACKVVWIVWIVFCARIVVVELHRTLMVICTQPNGKTIFRAPFSGLNMKTCSESIWCLKTVYDMYLFWYDRVWRYRLRHMDW